MVAMVAIDLLDMAVLRLTLAPSQHHSPVGQEHGRTIPLADRFKLAVDRGLYMENRGRAAARKHRETINILSRLLPACPRR